MLKEYPVYVDIKNEKYTLTKVKELDNVKLTVYITDNGLVKNITGNTFVLNVRKYDKTLVVQDTNITIQDGAKGILSIELHIDALRIPGEAAAELEITDTNGTISTATFHIYVDAKVTHSTSPSSNTSTITELLQLAIAQGQLTKTELQEVIDTADLTTYASRGDVEEINASLADSTSLMEANVQFRGNEVTSRFQNTIKPIITFVSDDADIYDYHDNVKSVFINNSIPCVIAVPTLRVENADVNTMTYAQLKDLQDNHGYEIASHTHSHTSLLGMTETQLKNEFDTSKSLLNQNGLKCKNLCIPYGEYDNTVKQVAQKYFRGVRVSGGRTNPYPILNLNIWSYSTEFEDLTACKAKVDEALANNRWLVFLFHGWTFKTYPAQLQNLIDLIAYIKTKTVDVVTLDEGLNRQAPVIDIGANSEFRVGQDGLIYSKQVAMYYQNQDAVTNDSPMSAFQKESLNVCVIAGNKANFPEAKAGVLLTYNFKSDEIGYGWQEYHIFDATTKYVRYHNYPAGTWGGWVNPHDMSSIPYITALRGTYTGDTLPNAFPIGKVINTSVSANTVGMPSTSAGLLTINTTGLTTGGGTDYGYVTEEYTKYGTNEKWIRCATSGTAWSAWAKVTVV